MSAPAPLLAGTDTPTNFYILDSCKVVYVSTTKNASTGLRWLLADLAGEDFTRFYRSDAAHQTRLMTIHAPRDTWQHVRDYSQLDGADHARISRDNGWFVFAVTRDPWQRLWSSWQSKMLVRQRAYVERYAWMDWFPRVPHSAADVLADWRTFVVQRPWRNTAPLTKDRHFAQQTFAIGPRRVNYTRIYDLIELSQLLADLKAHLAGLGVTKELYLPRANETALPMVREALDDELDRLVRRAYARDFQSFPDRWQRPELPSADDVWTDEALRAIRWRIESNERVGDLSRELRRLHGTRTYKTMQRLRRAPLPERTRRWLFDPTVGTS